MGNRQAKRKENRRLKRLKTRFTKSKYQMRLERRRDPAPLVPVTVANGHEVIPDGETIGTISGKHPTKGFGFIQIGQVSVFVPPDLVRAASDQFQERAKVTCTVDWNAKIGPRVEKILSIRPPSN